MTEYAIAVDAMGGDKAPEEIVAGAVEAAGSLSCRIILVGPKDELERTLSSYSDVPDNLIIEHASGVVAMGEKATVGIRRKDTDSDEEESSISRAMGLMKSGQASAVMSAGNTGAVMAHALTTLGRIKGISRPAIGVVLPARGHPVILLDAGANADCKASYLNQFAFMGAAFAQCIFGMRNPRVGLVNIGEESTKGNSLSQETHHSLSNSKLNFIGNVEGQQILSGVSDIIVCDGFTGNVILKTLEGMVEFFSAELKEEISKTYRGKLGGKVLLPTLRRLAKRHDSESYGGAYLLGIKGVAVIAHGRSSRKAIAAAIKMSARAVESQLVSALEKSLRNDEGKPEAGNSNATGREMKASMPKISDPPLQWPA